MSFKDLLDKYKNGTASEEETVLVEEELQKYEVISDYLSEGYDIDFQNHSLNLIDNTDTTSVKRTVNKKLRKTILSSVIIVFSILFTTNYIISPLVSSFYYNPSQKSVAKYHDDLYFDLKAFTELNLPGYSINSAGAEGLGFGEYNIFFQRINLFNKEVDSINTKMKRNIKTGRWQDLFVGNPLDFMDILHPDSKNKELSEMKNKEAINHIKSLNPVSYISSNLIFQEDLSIEEIHELRIKYNDAISFKWIGVRTENEGNSVNYLSGFNPNMNDGSVSGDSADKDKYPYLQLVDAMTDKRNPARSESIMVEAYTKHFTSLLKYAKDREKAVDALDTDAKSAYYKNALNYVETNGINIYGVLVYGEAEKLLEFIANEKVKAIEINGVLPSKYINYSYTN